MTKKVQMKNLYWECNGLSGGNADILNNPEVKEFRKKSIKAPTVIFKGSGWAGKK